LTDAELAQYDGKNPEKPIYVAINGSVFDVSANPHMYGPGGGYAFFAGRDAARAFVSGCFQDDLTWDLRGLEEMFINGEERKEDDAEAAEIYELTQHIKTGESHEKYEKIVPEGRLRWLKRRREKRRAEALEKVEKQIEHWDNFFRNHDKYFYVGKVIHPSLEGEPIRKLCKSQGKPRKKST
jgi:predicted heme/steroid binding protein